MIPSTISKRLMISLALFGTLAVLTGVVLGFGASRSIAGAAPATHPRGTLGIGGLTAAPMTSPLFAEEKVTVDTAPSATGLTAPSALAAAPIAPPVRTASARSAARSASSRSTATAGGWNSARVSWYGPGFYGRKTASGAVLTQGMMNVAHRSLPFGTRIQFEYRGRTCIAVVNDRGPFVGGRTFDLGPGTATALGFGGVGTVKYRILGR